MSSRTVDLLAPDKNLKVEWRRDCGFSFTADLPAGLHTFGIQADLSEFDWDRLYYPLTIYGNTGQITGPWDFNLYESHKPLLPTWRIKFDGRYVGLFYLQRPTVEDIERRTLRGEFGFHLEKAGVIEVQAEPYNTFNISPIGFYLEPNNFDRLEPQSWAGRGLAANWAASSGRPESWKRVRRQWSADSLMMQLLQEGLKRYRAVLAKAVTPPPDALPSLIAAYRLLDDQEAIGEVHSIIRHYLDLPAWGNPDPDGYGYNGDMGCALVIKHLALAYAWLSDDETAGMRPALLKRLEEQIAIFMEQQLLHAHYWGGAIMQDHGYRSTACLTFAALSLLGYSERAPFWLSFCVPRIWRTVRALPEDGFIPFSSYHKISLYGADVADLHVALKHASGVSLVSQNCFRNVPCYLMAALDEASMSFLVSSNRGDRKDLNCGLNFLLLLAQEDDNRPAAWLAHKMIHHSLHTEGFVIPGYLKPFEAIPFLIHACNDVPSAPTERPTISSLNHFPDGGFLSYNVPDKRLHISVNAYPPSGAFHAAGLDLSGTDMGIPNPSAGHFSVAIGAEPLIQNAESGYRTGSRLSNIPLFDDNGQYGDIGYTMGVPLRNHNCARIQTCYAAGEDGGARVNMTAAYPQELGVLTATRDFTFSPEELIVTDTLITRTERTVSWHFHTWQRHELIMVAAGRFRFSWQGRGVELIVSGCEGMKFAIGDTEVVWAYVNEQQDQPFRHLRCMAPPACATRVTFTVRPL